MKGFPSFCMRTLVSWLSAILLTLQAVPVLAEETATEDAVAEAPAVVLTQEEMDDATCRTELEIGEGRITKYYLLSLYRRCLNRERKAREELLKVERFQDKKDAMTKAAQPRLEILRRGSRRVIQNQAAFQMLQNRNKNLKSGKSTFQRVRRRDSYPITGSGGMKP